MGKLIEAKKEEFNHILETDKNIILADFWAQWCGPCKVLGPVLADIANELEDVTVVKINIDEADNSTLAAQFAIRNIPTVVIFKDGEQVDKFVGVKKKEEIILLIERNRETKNIDESKN